MRKLALIIALAVLFSGCDSVKQYQETQGNADAPPNDPQCKR